jgi:hypothetical protein
VDGVALGHIKLRNVPALAFMHGKELDDALKRRIIVSSVQGGQCTVADATAVAAVWAVDMGRFPTQNFTLRLPCARGQAPKPPHCFSQ